MKRKLADRILKQAARRADIKKRVHCHLFRHMRALAFSRAGAQDDVILNAMGWTDMKMFWTRYGRRPHEETLEESRSVLLQERHRAVNTEEFIARAYTRFERGEISEEAYLKTLDALGMTRRPKAKEEDEKPEVWVE